MIARLHERLEALQAEWHEAKSLEKLITLLEEYPGPWAVAREVEEIYGALPLEPRAEPAQAQSGLSLARLAVAATGTLLMPGRDTASLLPEISIVLLQRERIVANLDDLVACVGENPDEHLVAVAGASRTADIEKTLVLGAHGPGRLIVILI